MLVAITIDTEHPDRPHCPAGALNRTLEVLATREVNATFFLQGRWASAYPDQAKAIADLSHLIGNHSHFHMAMKLLDDRAIRIDIEAAEKAMEEAAGVSPKPWFRLPFLNGVDDARVLGNSGAEFILIDDPRAESLIETAQPSFA